MLLRMMLSSYVRSLAEYWLPPLILGSDTYFVNAINFECSPRNKNELRTMIIGFDPRKIIMGRINLIHKRLIKMLPEWISSAIHTDQH